MTVALDVATPSRSRSLELPPCDHRPRPYAGATREEILALRRQHVNPALFTLYSDPVMLVEGHRQYVWDETGRRYLDLFAGICTVACGHSHPRIVAAVQEQMALLAHGSTAFLHPNMPRFAEALLAKLPPSLDRIYFVNSGSEANDLAIQMARLHTGHADVIGIRNAYHGGSAPTGALTGIHTWKSGVQRGGPVHHALNPDPYRNPFSGTPEQIASRSAEDVAELIRYSTPGQVAAFISEPIQGAGGVTMGAPNYLPEVYDIVRAHGGVCIADEVQTGFGRTGDNFWGFERSGVVPEIVTMAKGIGNGLPLAAVATTSEIAAALAQRLHINTFGGNPLVSAAGLAVLEVIEEEGLQRNALALGSRLLAGLRALAHDHEAIGDVRGQGLMIGVELVADRKARTPGTALTGRVLDELKDLGALVGKGGLYGNVLRIKPPLVLTDADVEFALAAMDEALTRAAK
ncbi:MAG: aspartate aminotransferase family protein [Acidobacteria bacterium]|nr:aspartate aminotransferase family protein [Acidobacteriota bacterium]